MARLLVLVVLASIFGSVIAAPVPKSGPKPPWKFPTQVGTEWVHDCKGGRTNEMTETVTKVEEKGGEQLIRLRRASEAAIDGMEVSYIDAWTLVIGDDGWLGMRGPKPDFCLLKLPHSVGDVWAWKHTNTYFDRTVSQVVLEEKIKVPAGTFDCVRVEIKAYDGKNLEWTETNWYASGVGLVKSTGGPNEKRVQVLKKFTLGKG
jgi:hypothetical protein